MSARKKKTAPKKRRTVADLEKALAELAHEVSGMKDGHHFERNAVRQLIKRLQARVDELELKLPHVCLLASRLEKLEKLAKAMGPLWKTQSGHTRPITMLSTCHLRTLLTGGWVRQSMREAIESELRRREIDDEWRAKDKVSAEALAAIAESFNAHLPEVNVVGDKLVFGTSEYLRAKKEEAEIEEAARDARLDAEVAAFADLCKRERLDRERKHAKAYARKRVGFYKRLRASWIAFRNSEAE